MPGELVPAGAGVPEEGPDIAAVLRAAGVRIPEGAQVTVSWEVSSLRGTDFTPSWVILGIRDAGYRVLASATLRCGELTRHRAGHHAVAMPHGRPAMLPVELWRCTLEFGNFVMINGDSYASAMDTLSQHWTPPDE